MVPAAVARYHLHRVNRGAVSFGFNDRLVVIFGVGPGSPEDQGQVAPCVYPNCHNQVFLHHVRSKKSVRLYFVPVVPYGTDDYLVCAVCSRGLQVSDAQLRHVRSMSAATASFRAARSPDPVHGAGRGVLASARAEPRRAAALDSGQPRCSRAPQPAAAVMSALPALPPPPAADDQTPWISRLHQLVRLHNQGVLSDAAYTAAKERILEQDKQPQPPGADIIAGSAAGQLTPYEPGEVRPPARTNDLQIAQPPDRRHRTLSR